MAQVKSNRLLIVTHPPHFRYHNLHSSREVAYCCSWSIIYFPFSYTCVDLCVYSTFKTAIKHKIVYKVLPPSIITPYKLHECMSLWPVKC